MGIREWVQAYKRRKSAIRSELETSRICNQTNALTSSEFASIYAVGVEDIEGDWRSQKCGEGGLCQAGPFVV